MPDQKTDGEKFQEFLEEQEEREKVIAESYAEAGTLPPGVVNRNPDTTTPEANYVSRDNIVVSGASPHNVQAAVNNLATQESRDKALDAADVAQSVSREDYDAAVLAAAPTATEKQREDAPQEVVDLRDDDAHDEDEPRASGGAQVDEDVLESAEDQSGDEVEHPQDVQDDPNAAA
jgi:hypothetical protein